MGNGLGKAGASFGGFQPADPTPAPGPVETPWALKYDGATADFAQLEDGSYDEVHPVTHEVMLRLAIKLGAVPVTREIGSTLSEVKIADQTAMTIDARRRTEQALDDLIADGKIEIDGVQAFAPNRWRMKYKISFTNLVETRPDQRLQRLVVGDTHG